MITHIFRPPNFKPNPVNSLCSNGKYIVSFRRFGNLEFYESVSLVKCLTWDIGLEVIDSYFVDLNTIIVLTVCNKVASFDIKTMTVKILINDVKHIFGEFKTIQFSEIEFYFVSLRNEIFHYSQEKQILIKRCKANITALRVCNKRIVVGVDNGFIYVSDSNNQFNEIDIGTIPNKIISYEINKAIMVGKNGSIVLVDLNACIVLDRINIRQSSLDVCDVLNDKVFVSGIDSRITCITIINNRFFKSFQGDPHFSDTLCMITDGGRIITSGEDSVIVVSSIVENGFRFQKIYDTLHTGVTKNYFYTTFESEINIYKFNKIDKSISKYQDQDRNKITFKISEDILTSSNQNETIFSNVLRIHSKHKILTSFMCYDENFIAHSNSIETVIHKIVFDGTFKVIKITCLEPSVKIIIRSSIMMIQFLSGVVKLYSLDDNIKPICEFIDKFSIFDHLILGNNLLCCVNQKIIINITSHDVTNIDFHGILKGYFNTDSGFLIISESEDSTIFNYLENDKRSKTYKNRLSTVGSKDPIPFKNILHNFSDYFTNSKYLFKVNDDVSIYNIGSNIHNIFLHNNDLIIVQTSIESIMDVCKKSIFKEKFSNK